MMIRETAFIALCSVSPIAVGQVPTVSCADSEAVDVEWRLSKGLLEEDGVVELVVHLDRGVPDPVVVTPQWATSDTTEFAIDPSRVDIPPLVLAPCERDLVVELRLPRDQIKQLDTQVELTLAFGSRSVRADTTRLYRLQLLDVASDSILHIGMEKVFQQDSVFQALNAHRRVHFPWLPHPPWTVPTDPTWKEDPFNDTSWSIYYHSLEWTVAYGRGFELTGDKGNLEAMKSIVLDYIEDNKNVPGAPIFPRYRHVDADAPDSTNWSSHVVAARAEALGYIYRAYLKDILDESQQQTLINFLLEHGRLLHGFATEHYVGHNHGLMVAQALLKITYAFPEATAETGWREASTRRIRELSGELVDLESGVSTEQSMFYHYFAMELLTKAHGLLVALGEPSSADIASSAAKMLAYAALTLYPDGTAPAYGDTKHGFKFWPRLRSLYQRLGGQVDLVDFVLSKSESGSPPHPVTLVPSEGYVILRPQRHFIRSRDWLNQPVVFVDFGKQMRSHGHHDAMSFSAYFQGEEILVDAGGPYLYMEPFRNLIVSQSRGNTLVIDGYETVDRSATVAHVYDEPGLWGATGELIQQGVTSTRTVAWLKPGALLVIDQMKPESNTEHEYALFHHYPPGSEAHVTDTDFHIRTANGLTVRQRTITSATAGRIVHLPQPTDQPLSSRGWVVTGLSEAVPAPVSEVSMTAAGKAWMVTVITTNDETSEPAVSVVESDSDLRVSVGDFGVTYSLDGKVLK